MSSLVWQPMSYDEYLRTPTELRAEWIDGAAVMAPSPDWRHQRVVHRLVVMLEEAFPGLLTLAEVTVRLGPDFEPIPDVVVVESQPGGTHVEEVPLVVVEVLAPGNRSHDTGLKRERYLRHGVGQYWLVDRIAGTLEVLRHNGTAWASSLQLHDAAPIGSVGVGDHGAVVLDLRELLPGATPTS